MTNSTEIDTDLAQFQDVMEAGGLGRRESDDIQVESCDEEGCSRIVLVEKRLNRHRKDIDELKTLIKANGDAVEKNSEDTAEILAIVTKGKNFFSVLDWVGTKVVGVGTLIGMIVAAVLWLRPGGKP
jgi:hypothetical protein